MGRAIACTRENHIACTRENNIACARVTFGGRRSPL